MNRDTAVRTWRDVCGSDTVMAMGVVTGRMLEEFASRIEAAERERWKALGSRLYAAIGEALPAGPLPDELKAAGQAWTDACGA